MVILVISRTFGVVGDRSQEVIPHFGDGSAWWNSVYMDHQIVQSFHKSVWGVAINLLYSGLGKERPEGPIMRNGTSKSCLHHFFLEICLFIINGESESYMQNL